MQLSCKSTIFAGLNATLLQFCWSMGAVRNTKSVRTICKRFEETTSALSVVQLIDEYQKSMSRTTVYRILDRLEGNGTLHSFIGKDGNKWYAKCRNYSTSQPHGLHPHFQCSECGKTECLDVPVALPIVSRHQVDKAEVLLIGRCENCLELQ